MAALLAGGAALAWPTVASAQPYPAGPPDLTVDTAAVTPGSRATVTGAGFLPFEVIDVQVTNAGNAPRATLFMPADTQVRADALGRFTASGTATRPGTVTITATGQTSGVVVTTTLVVLAPAQGGSGGQSGGQGGGNGGGQGGGQGGSLPVTGTDGGVLLTQVLVGAFALVVGIGLAWLSVRRRRRGPEHSAP
jgi:hypothetical protein